MEDTSVRADGDGAKPEPREAEAEAEDEDEDEDEDEAEAETIHRRDLTMLVGFLGPFAAPYRRQLLVLGIVLLIEALFDFCFPLATQYLVDEGLLRRNV